MEMENWEWKNEKMREQMSINIENKNNQTIVGYTMIIMVFAYLVIDNWEWWKWKNNDENDANERMRMMKKWRKK